MSIDSRASLDRHPNKTNWVENSGGLPMYVRRIANHLHQEKGMDISRSIAVAVNVVKRMCASGDTNYPGIQHVQPQHQAEACAAVAEWEAKKASARVTKSNIRGRKMTDKEYIGMLTVEEVLKAGFNPKELRGFGGKWVHSAAAKAERAASEKERNQMNLGPNQIGRWGKGISKDRVVSRPRSDMTTAHVNEVNDRLTTEGKSVYHQQRAHGQDHTAAMKESVSYSGDQGPKTQAFKDASSKQASEEYARARTYKQKKNRMVPINPNDPREGGRPAKLGEKTYPRKKTATKTPIKFTTRKIKKSIMSDAEFAALVVEADFQ